MMLCSGDPRCLIVVLITAVFWVRQNLRALNRINIRTCAYWYCSFSGYVTTDSPSDRIKRSIQHIQKKTGVLLVQTHRRGKTDCLTV